MVTIEKLEILSPRTAGERRVKRPGDRPHSQWSVSVPDTRRRHCGTLHRGGCPLERRERGRSSGRTTTRGVEVTHASEGRKTSYSPEILTAMKLTLDAGIIGILDTALTLYRDSFYTWRWSRPYSILTSAVDESVSEYRAIVRIISSRSLATTTGRLAKPCPPDPSTPQDLVELVLIDLW